MTSPVWHPFTQHGLGEPIPTVVRTEGAALHTAEGARIVDAISSWWVTTHGHRHPAIMAAIAEATEHLDQIIFAGWTHEPAETVAAALVEMMPAPLAHVFFSDSGSTSVEVAIKMALGFWLNTNRPRSRMAVLEGSYHGDTVGGMSLGERGVFNRAYAPLLFEVETLSFPDPGEEQRTLDALDRLARSPDPLAALIVEPLLLGAGGMRMYSPAILAEMRAICTRHDVLFIADEVMTGWGRTGSLLACDQAGVVPDILCLSKGLTGGAVPLAVTMATRPIFDAHRSEDRARMFFHSSSYTANPIACAAARANLAIWRDEPVLDRIAALAERQRIRHTPLAERPMFRNVRQLGTVTALELAEPKSDYLSALGPMLMRFFIDRGVLLRPLGNTIYVMPPYCIDDADLDLVYGLIAEAGDRFGR
ncbi:MAG TPA: adenosylmethionine--8-amino-7-oxononanoate transaminase [Sphingomonas sp.]|nr:adenosylmethionine--8-amino-7-oxononanoate transaminase [Sphingomonas sp.]